MKYIIFFGVILSVVISLYIYFNRKKYTRERYAFFATTSIFFFAGIIILHFFSDNSMIKIAVELLNSTLGIKLSVPQTSWSDKAWSLLIFIILGIIIHSFHKNWDGAKSKYEVQHNSQDMMKNFLMGIPGKKISISIDNEIEIQEVHRPYLDVPLDWHSDVAQMLKIISNKYYIDKERDWYSEENLFISKYSHQNMAILCVLNKPSMEEIKIKIRFVEQHIEGSLDKFIVAIKNEKKNVSKLTVDETEVEYRYKEELLDSLVDFNEYFDNIKNEFEINEISYGDKFTLQDIYTQSKGEIRNLKNTSETKSLVSVEDYLLEWTKSKSNKQISLLGEYGQGKSVLSLKLAYEMIKNNYNRIPIIIELRGKSPRNEQLEDIIGSWARKYHIDPMGIFRLMIEGKLLIILEGFDEIDMIGDSNRRLEHFNRLWEFARYEKSKVMITGRPNLFLDNEEMNQYLKSYKNDSNPFYSESIDLKVFSLEQIAYSLRNIDMNVRNEILQLLVEKYEKRVNESLSSCPDKMLKLLGKEKLIEISNEHLSGFEDLMARPSTLYQASIIWKEIDKENINSAIVIESFLNHAYRRQEEKLQTIGRTGIETLLTTNERKYFILGIAVGIKEKSRYTNTINSTDLTIIIQKLYTTIPKEVSFDHPNNRSLKNRMQDNKHALDSIYNDIRTSTVLVRDYSKNDSFKFAHKSFLEYLNAKYFVLNRFKNKEEMFPDRLNYLLVKGISQVYGLNSSLNFSDEVIDFIVDILNKGKIKDCQNLLDVFTKKEKFLLFTKRRINWISYTSIMGMTIAVASGVVVVFSLIVDYNYIFNYLEIIFFIILISGSLSIITFTLFIINTMFMSKIRTLVQILIKCENRFNKSFS